MNWDECIFNAELSTPWIVTQLQNFTNWHLTPLPTTGFVDEIKLNREGVKETPFFVRFWENKRWNSGQQQQYVFQDFTRILLTGQKRRFSGRFLFFRGFDLVWDSAIPPPTFGNTFPPKKTFFYAFPYPLSIHQEHIAFDFMRMLICWECWLTSSVTKQERTERATDCKENCKVVTNQKRKTKFAEPHRCLKSTHFYLVHSWGAAVWGVFTAQHTGCNVNMM